MPVNIGTKPAGMWYNEWKALKSKEKEDPFCLSRAMDNWETKMLSGAAALTEEEKEQIREAVARWLEENPLKTDEDKQAFTAFVKQLYMSFGARHDLMYFIGDVAVSHWIENNPLETEQDKVDFSNFVSLVEGSLEKVSEAMRDYRNRPLLNFDSKEADPIPSRLFPLQFELMQK